MASLSQHRASASSLERIAGVSPWAKQVRQAIELVAAHQSSVLILGPSGTGKELIARAIHATGKRAAKPFIPVDCAVTTGTLFASHMFGHVKGSFTGATSSTLGCFRAASGGTIFLDEIGEMELELQAKLLRVLQQRTVVPVGSHDEIPVDVRVVAATNRDLGREVTEGRFREDLYYRLNVVTIRTSPLKDRTEDIPVLAARYLAELAARHGMPMCSLTEEAIDVLRQYSWPGNVRELENVVQRANVLAKGETILAKDLPSDVLTPRRPAPAAAAAPAATSVAAPAPETGLVPSYDAIYRGCREGDGKSILNVIEMEMIKRAMEETRGNQLRTALILGINRSTLKKRLGEMREAGIRVFT